VDDRARSRPTITVTLQAPAATADPERARARNDRYLEAVERAGGRPLPLDETAGDEARRDALAAMDGLLLSGGGDLHPRLYGQAVQGTDRIEAGRDALEQAAWQEARARGLPVLGICRGLQAINVFSGGSLVQHLDGHRPAAGSEEPRRHPLRVVGGSRLARILHPTHPGGGVLRVNSSHHQAVRPADLAPTLLASGLSPHPEGELVEALESTEPDAFVIGVQCHPERTESTPPEFGRLFEVFVDACRRAAVDRPTQL
jgi:putative glutamine amidotransferase